MSKQLRAEVEVEASPERVWEVLTDFAAYRQWNPFIVHGAGQAVPGRPLELRLRLPRPPPTRTRPEVVGPAPGRRLRWLGRLLVPGLFDGEHSFTLELAGSGRVR